MLFLMSHYTYNILKSLNGLSNLLIKLKIFNIEEQVNNITTFIKNMFPSVHMLSENGGLLTYEVPKSEMKMSLAFKELEENKITLCIEDYSIAQPTLEQVDHLLVSFIYAYI